MDKFVTRTKRKTPDAEPPKSKETAPKQPKNSKMLNKLRNEDKKVVKEASALTEILPTIKREEGKAISNEDLEKLFFALCGDTGKLYDSDDSLLSDHDQMDDEEIAARDKQMLEIREAIRRLPEKKRELLEMHNISKETPKQREERRRLIREFLMENKTISEKEKAEKKRLNGIKRMEQKLNTVVQVFKQDEAKLSKLDEDAPSLISCRQFSRCLDVMINCLGDDLKGDDGYLDIRKTIKEIDTDQLERGLKSMGIRTTFYSENKSVGEYLKKKVRKLFCDATILDVVDGERYGFDFGTKDCISALQSYYSLNEPKKSDNGASPLAIKIRPFVECCYYVARRNDSNFKLNDSLKYAMFG